MKLAQNWKDYAVLATGWLRLGVDYLAEGWQHIPECAHKVGFAPLGHTPLPRDYHRHTYSALIQVALVTTVYAVAVEEIGVGATLQVRTVVTRKYDYGILVKAFLLQLLHNLPHIHVKSRNHCGKSGMWIQLCAISAFAE